MTTALRRYSSTGNQSISYFSDGEISVSSIGMFGCTDRQFSGVKHGLRTTVAAFGIALTPAFAIASTIPTNPPIASVAAQAQERLAVAVYQFELASNERGVFKFLKEEREASKLISSLPVITTSIYGKGVVKKLEILLDREASKEVMIVELHTGIEDEDEFLVAEEELFDLIAQCGLEGGLDRVVLSLY